jgi:hypothetical protein
MPFAPSMSSHDGSRRGAPPETSLPSGTRPHQASRRDATFISPLEPWVETHGYPQGSLRDRGTPTHAEHQARNRSPELCIKTKRRPAGGGKAIGGSDRGSRIEDRGSQIEDKEPRSAHIHPQSTIPHLLLSPGSLFSSCHAFHDLCVAMVLLTSGPHG